MIALVNYILNGTFLRYLVIILQSFTLIKRFLVFLINSFANQWRRLYTLVKVGQEGVMKCVICRIL